MWLLNNVIIIKTKVLLPKHSYHSRFWLSCLCPLVFWLPKPRLAFLYVYVECTWCKLVQHIKLEQWVIVVTLNEQLVLATSIYIMVRASYIRLNLFRCPLCTRPTVRFLC